jgi:hypothetical protein
MKGAMAFSSKFLKTPGRHTGQSPLDFSCRQKNRSIKTPLPPKKDKAAATRTQGSNKP